MKKKKPMRCIVAAHGLFRGIRSVCHDVSGPGADAAEFGYPGIAERSKLGGRLSAAIAAAAVDKNQLILVGERRRG